MPGPIMSASKAYENYGKKYRSMKKRGSKIELRDSTGSKVMVSGSRQVYHRGKGKFGIYSSKADKKRSAKRMNERFGKKSYAVGTGKYRHTHDGTGRKKKK